VIAFDFQVLEVHFVGDKVDGAAHRLGLSGAVGGADAAWEGDEGSAGHKHLLVADGAGGGTVLGPGGWVSYHLEGGSCAACGARDSSVNALGIAVVKLGPPEAIEEAPEGGKFLGRGSPLAGSGHREGEVSGWGGRLALTAETLQELSGALGCAHLYTWSVPCPHGWLVRRSPSFPPSPPLRAAASVVAST
jgi:hypothetical protein